MVPKVEKGPTRCKRCHRFCFFVTQAIKRNFTKPLKNKSETTKKILTKICEDPLWARQDSNLGPPPYQGRSGTSESVCLLSLAHFCLSPLFAWFNRHVLLLWYEFLVCMQKWAKLGKSMQNYAKMRYEFAFFRAAATNRFRVGGFGPCFMKNN